MAVSLWHVCIKVDSDITRSKGKNTAEEARFYKQYDRSIPSLDATDAAGYSSFDETARAGTAKRAGGRPPL